MVTDSAALCQDMIVSILPGGQQGSAWRQPHQKVALAMRLVIFAAGGLTAYAVSHSNIVYKACNRQTPLELCVTTCAWLPSCLYISCDT